MTIDAAFPRFPELTTQRLRLRQVRPDDAEAFFAIFSDEETMKYYGHAPHSTIDKTREWITQVEARYTQREAIRWGVTFADQDEIIGSCSFHHFAAHGQCVETGYDLNRVYWGQGVMTEAMSAVLTYGFSTLELHRIEAIIDIQNVRSKALLEKLGFTYEGNLRQRYYMEGRFGDEHYFGLLKDEWHG
jgi:[ribosomal protein S5]-alanine N-acetyltransferase